MTADADDLESLFDEVASQRTESSSPPDAEHTAPSGETEAVESSDTTADDATAIDIDLSEKPMYERLGGIVRLLHDSLRELGYDRSLTDVAHQITDAQGRLTYIATLTEQAAVKVLNAVDGSMPEQDALAEKAKEMDSRWTQLFEGKLSIEEFKTLAGDSKNFAAIVTQATDAEKARLLEIMMAQDFQDITGQLIKKIVSITSTAERELAQLLRDNAPPEIKAAIAAEQNKADKADKPEDLMQGPATDGNAMAQDDVDSLLADLGF